MNKIAFQTTDIPVTPEEEKESPSPAADQKASEPEEGEAEPEVSTPAQPERVHTLDLSDEPYPHERLSADEEELLDTPDREDELRFAKRQVVSPDQPASKLRTAGILFAVCLVIAVIGGAIALVLRDSSNRERMVRDYQDTAGDIWARRVDNSRAIKSAVDQVRDTGGFPGLAIVINTERAALGSDIPVLTSITVPQQYSSEHGALVGFVIAYKDYLDAVMVIIGQTDVTRIEATSLKAMVQDGQELARLAGLYRLDTDFIKQDIDPTVFTVLPENSKRFVEDAQDRITGERQQEEDAQKEQEQALMDVKDAVEGFLQAYIEADETLAASYLSEGAGNAYVLDQVEGDLVVDMEWISTTEKELYYLVVAKVTREMPDPDFVPPVSGPVGEVPLIRQSANQEFHVIRENDAFKLDFIDFLE